jgi:hypothetical protein
MKVEPIRRVGRLREAQPEPEAPLRLGMPLADAERISAWLVAERGSPSVAMLRELIWLRAVLIEQWHRTPTAERQRFARRANRVLEQLGRCSGCLSEATITVEHHEKR